MVDIFKCTCENKFQDETYGVKMRVMNSTGKDKAAGWRCTVCGKEYRVGETRK